MSLDRHLPELSNLYPISLVNRAQKCVLLHWNAAFAPITFGVGLFKSGAEKKKEYIDTVSVVVDQDEYNEARANLPDIEKEIVEYIETYVNHINGSISIHRREYERKYKFSTLPYFHDVLGLDRI